MGNPFDQAAAAFEEQVAKKGETAPERAVAAPEERLVLGVGAHNIRDDQYHADPAPEPSLSSSLAKKIIGRSCRHAWEASPRLNPNFERKEKTIFDLGSAFHKLILEKGAEIEVFDFKDWKTNDAKAEKAAAYARGSIPLLRPQFERTQAMVSAVRAQMPRCQELAYAMSSGSPEVVLIWEEQTPAGPIHCRAMLDWHPYQGNLFPDWKSTEGGAGPADWGDKTMWQMDSHIQAAFYKRGIKAVLGLDAELFFAVAELESPHALATMRPVPSAVATANRAVEYAIAMWGLCLRSGRWPGYSPQMAWVDMPAWKERSFLEREERGGFDPKTAWAMYEALGEKKDLPPLPNAEADPDCPFGLPAIDKDSSK